MPRRAQPPCSRPGCGQLKPCPTHSGDSERRRGTAAQRGYGARHRDHFRAKVLEREPTCRLCGDPATDADHWPFSRKQLIAKGADPDNPEHGRGLCGPCHKAETAKNQPGGWNSR